MPQIIYLHGFASGPGSSKAAKFKKAFDGISVSLAIPDLEGGDFQGLSLSGQINIINDCMDQNPGERFGLIGSSMGGVPCRARGAKAKRCVCHLSDGAGI